MTKTSLPASSTKQLKWFLLLVPALAIFCGYGDAAPCDEQVDRPAHEKLILANPVIAQLNMKLQVARMDVGYCFYKGAVSSTLIYELPPEWSPRRITYTSIIGLQYFKDGHFEFIMPGESKPQVLDYERIIADFKAKILAVETNSSARVKEVISRIEPTRGSLSTGYFSRQTPDGFWLIQYSFVPDQGSWEYWLPNSLEWSEFPEIETAQQFVEKNLLVGNLSSCYITRSGFHSGIGGKQWGGGEPTWYMTVPLTCEDGPKDVQVKIDGDGSVQDLGITWEAKTK